MYTPRLDVLALPLAPSLRSKLLTAGFRTTRDLDGIGPVDLAKGMLCPSMLGTGILIFDYFLTPLLCPEAEITAQEAVQVLKTSKPRLEPDGSISGLLQRAHARGLCFLDGKYDCLITCLPCFCHRRLLSCAAL